MNAALWVLQWLLAALFAFAGLIKFLIPVSEMTKNMPLSGTLIHFIGVCEIAGALGLVLPALVRIRPILTPLAALGLLVIMAGAVALTLPMGAAAAGLPAGVALLVAFLAYGRMRLVPLHR